MGASDIRAGGGYIELWADKKKLSQGFKDATNESKQWASQITALGMGLSTAGAVITGSLGFSAIAFANAGSRIDDFSQRTGASVEAISALKYAAEQSGTNIDSLEKGMSAMSRTISGAVLGEESATAALKQLGLTAGALRGQLPEKQLAMFADKFAAIGSVNLKEDLAKAIFGGGGHDLIPLLASGAAGLDKLRDRANQLGLAMSSEDVAAAAAFGDSLDDLKAGAMALTNAVGAALAPALKAGTDLMVAGVKPVADFIKENKALITTVGAAGAALLVVGGALTTVGLAATAVGVAIPGLTALGGAAAVAAPWLLLGGGIAAASAALLHFSGGFTMLSRVANQTLGNITALAQGIANALQKGDFKAAWDIAGAGLNVSWIATVNALKGTWRDFTTFMVDNFIEASQLVVAAMQRMPGINFAPGLKETQYTLAALKGVAHGLAAVSAGNDIRQLTAAQESLKVLLESVKPEDRVTFGAGGEIDPVTGKKKDDKHTGKTDETRDAITARGAIGLGGFTSLQERMGADIRASLAELKGINQKTGRVTGMGGKQFGFAKGQAPADVAPDLLGLGVPPMDMKPDTTPLHNPVAGNMLGISLPADFKGGELAPQTPIRDIGSGKATSTEERVAKATEATAKDTKRIADSAEKGIAYGT